MIYYHICPTCSKLVKKTAYKRHSQKHGKMKAKDNRLKLKLKQLLDKARKEWNNNPRPLSIYFEIAKIIMFKVEGSDTTSWDYILDSEYPEMMAELIPKSSSKISPVMCHIRFEVKDKTKFDGLIEKYHDTEKEYIIRKMVSTSIPLIVVFLEEWVRLKQTEWITPSNIMIMSVYFFLHEMYHILGYGEWDAGRKSTVAVHRIFGMLLSIPETEIERWKSDKRKKDKRLQTLSK